MVFSVMQTKQHTFRLSHLAGAYRAQLLGWCGHVASGMISGKSMILAYTTQRPVGITVTNKKLGPLRRGYPKMMPSNQTRA